MPQSFRHIVMTLSLCWLSACTAWQYDIEACDVHARDLSKDVCNTLNDGSSGCMIYQCDGQTASCRPSVRDFDRDGDPDVACGGTDCNDYDPAVYGRQGDLCTCRQDLLGQSCKVGQPGSACERQAKYACFNNTLTCPATPGAPQAEYQAGPDGTNNSWDWNCDGAIDQACSWMDQTGRYYRADCPQTVCSDAVKTQLAANMPLKLCDAYCGTLTGKDACQAANPALLNCDAQPFCGSHVGVCSCIWDVSFSNFFQGACITQPFSTIGSIYCK